MPQTNLQVIREGNPGHRTKAELRPGIKAPAKVPDEPDWQAIFPPLRPLGTDSEEQAIEREALKRANDRMRKRARELWRTWAEILGSIGVLTELDAVALEDAAATAARIRELDRDLSVRGVYRASKRGAATNPSLTALNQLRPHLRALMGQLGLTPVARDRIHPDAGGRSDGAFD